jgi:hypothetical protein
MYRIRKSLSTLAAGEDAPPVQLRQGDFWQETAHDFNVVMHRLRSLQAQSTSAGKEVGISLPEPAAAGTSHEKE